MSVKKNWNLPDAKQARKRTKNPVQTLHFERTLEPIGTGKTYFISTYGCQANERDSENLSGLLESMNFTRAADASQADLILINTCGVRENASNHVLGEIGFYKQYMNSERKPILGVCGCMVQDEGFSVKLLEKYPWVQLLFGTHNLHQIDEYLKRVFDGEKVVEIYSREGEVIEDLPSRRESRHKAWVNIMHGCDKFCTYCIVPYTRGKQRSRKPEAILDEIRALKKLDYKEITLLGQNVNAYGKDLDSQMDFASLLEEAAKTGIERIRFTTSHPWDFSDELIDVMSRYDNIMPSLHLPLQSGDDEILRRMGRRYTAEEYLELVRKIRKAIPNISLSTDIIVGFPMESDEAFQHTLDVVKEVGYENAFTFIYSPRPNTPAEKFEDNIDLKTKKERLIELNNLWNEYAIQKNREYEGKVEQVLVDGLSKKSSERYSGYTRSGKLVNFTGKDLNPGDLVDVYIEQAKTFSLNGRALEA